jgi:hypothetical protein
MDCRPQGGARTVETECTHFALLVAVFTDCGYPGKRVLAEYRTPDILLFVVHYQLRLVIRAYRSIQVPAMAPLEQKELTKNNRWCILRQLVSFR